MSRNTPYAITEWDWFRVQLQLYALERRAKAFSFYFELKPDEDFVVCEMHGISIEDTLKETTDKRELFEEYFSSWIRSIKREVAKYLSNLPVLGKEFDLEKHLVVEIMHDYGMGAALVCRIVGNDVTWNEGTLSSFMRDDG